MTNNHIPLCRLSTSCHENICIDKTPPTQHNNNTTAISVWSALLMCASRLQTTSFGTLVQKNHTEGSGATLRARHQRVTGRSDTKSLRYKSTFRNNQALKLHRTFDILHVNKKNILGEYSSSFKPTLLNYLYLDWINLCRNDFVSKRPATKHRMGMKNIVL